MKIRTPKQLEEWSFSINNSDNTIEDSNKIEDEKNATLIIEEEKENEESLYEECLQEENLGEEILQEEIIHEESCNIKCKVRSVQKRIKVLEADMEKSDYSVELIKTKVDLASLFILKFIFWEI
uniref:Uncharacterized protein n=1 Tax=Meloidogyne hapla TaxID=6305 RepID=A0A1I8B668_MELHA